MSRLLRSGDVVVADANVFIDLLPHVGIVRPNETEATNLLQLVKTRCARFGTNQKLLRQYLTSDPRFRRQPLSAQAITFIGELRDLDKLFEKAASAGECDEDSAEFKRLPKEDRFLLNVAAAVRARFIVTNDLSIPLHLHKVPLRSGGGHLEVEILSPIQLLERLR